MIGKPFWETPWWNHSKEAMRELKKAIKKASEGHLKKFETIHIDARGNKHFFDFVLKPILDDLGNVAYLIPEGHNITDKKMMEEELRESEENFRNIFNSSTDGILVVDFDFNILAANKKIIDLVDIDASKIRSLKANDFIFEEDLLIIRNRFDLLKAGKLLPTIEISIKRPNNEIFPAEINSRIINFQKKKAILTVIHDISDKKHLQRKLFEAQVESEERERERYAKELHDGLGPLISTCKIYFHSLKNQINENKRDEQIIRAGELLEDALSSIKEISNNLSPHILRNYGLFQALHSFVDKLTRVTDIEFIINSDAEKRYPEIIEFTLYRTIVELINNSVKYSGADTISIEISDHDRLLVVKYSENGKGFDYEHKIREGKGFGLMNLENRIKKIDGKYEYNTSPGNGVHVKISIKL